VPWGGFAESPEPAPYTGFSPWRSQAPPYVYWLCLGSWVLDGLRDVSEPRGTSVASEANMPQPMAQRLLRLHGLTERSEPRWEADAKGSQPAQVG